jgi:NDP-sugar pyrophosphorylase family protein
VELLDYLLEAPERENWVVLMAGGLGTRLAPLTDNCPKPLLKVGNKPILETIIENFISHGFKRFYLSVNYKAEMIEEYFGDGSRWGAEIRYLREDKKMGTAGALGLIPEPLTQPFLVMNGDLLTKVNFSQLLNFHQEQNAHATMCVREYDFQVPYGVVSVDKHRIKSIEEKPVHRFFVNAGIYVLDPEAVSLIPADMPYDMTSLFEQMTANEREVIAFPVREYWLDIGHRDDFERAAGDFARIFASD